MMVDSKRETEPPIELLRLLARTNANPAGQENSAVVAYSSNTATSDPQHVSTKSKSFVRGALITGALTCFVLVVGILGVYLLLNPEVSPKIALPGAQSTSPEPAAQPRERAVSDPSANQAVSQVSAELQSVRKAMADCDSQAAQDPKNLYLLIVPVSPNTDAATTAVPDGETYQTFFLMTSKAVLAGLQDASYRVNGWPFAFSIRNPNTGDRRDANLVSGLTQLRYSAEKFSKFRVGFDVSGRGYGMAWSNEYSNWPGACYWINVRLRSDQIQNQVRGWLPQNVVR